MAASGESYLKDMCMTNESGVCLGDGQTEAYLKVRAWRAWALARRRPQEYRRSERGEALLQRMPTPLTYLGGLVSVGSAQAQYIYRC